MGLDVWYGAVTTLDLEIESIFASRNGGKGGFVVILPLYFKSRFVNFIFWWRCREGRSNFFLLRIKVGSSRKRGAENYENPMSNFGVLGC